MFFRGSVNGTHIIREAYPTRQQKNIEFCMSGGLYSIPDKPDAPIFIMSVRNGRPSESIRSQMIGIVGAFSPP